MKKKFFRIYDTKGFKINEKLKFFFKIKKRSNLNKSKKKLTPHNKYYLNNINLNTHKNTFIFLKKKKFYFFINYDFYVNFNTMKLYIFLKSSFGDFYLNPYTTNDVILNLYKYSDKSLLTSINHQHNFNYLGYKISNIYINNNVYVTSCGTKTTMLGFNNNIMFFLLPSGKVFKKKVFYFFLGSNKLYSRLIEPIKLKKTKNYTIKVRGIAKNPVDHPNGGNSNTKGSFKTPWGYYAKKNK